MRSDQLSILPYLQTFVCDRVLRRAVDGRYRVMCQFAIESANSQVRLPADDKIDDVVYGAQSDMWLCHGVVLAMLFCVYRHIETWCCLQIRRAPLRVAYFHYLLYGTVDKNFARLQRLHNTAARLIMRVAKYSNITPVLKGLHWLKKSTACR